MNFPGERKTITPKNPKEDWRDTSWVNPEGEKVTIAQLLEYLGNQSVDLNVQELLAQLPPLPKREPHRIEGANLEHPIIVLKREGRFIAVLDGNHRLQKAGDNGEKNIKAKILDLDDPTTPPTFVKIFTWNNS